MEGIEDSQSIFVEVEPINEKRNGKINQKDKEIVTKIVKIDGKDYVQKQLTADDFLEYENRKVTQSIVLANQWIIYEAYGSVDLSKVKFRQRGKLLASLTEVKVVFNDDLPLGESSDFMIASNHFVEKENSGDHFDTFILRSSEASQKSRKEALKVYQQAIVDTLLMNGKEIEAHHFSKQAPEGIGFGAMGVLIKWIEAFLSSAQ